jgi:hypothetical protein
MDVDKDEYRRFSKHKIIGNIEEIVWNQISPRIS